MKSLWIFPSLMLIYALSWSMVVATQQFHSCPPLDDDVGGICSEECPPDGNCPGDQLCCSNGCGHACVDPVTIPYHTPPLTRCPPVDDDFAGTCEERCSDDGDCAEGERCCSNGCGHVCMAEVPLCTAVFQQVSNRSMIGSYVPQCEEGGAFSRAQCHASTGYCWCVEPEAGEPVSDVVRFKMPQCNCSYDGNTHYVGETFDAGDGCNTCSCTLDGGVKCTEVACPGQTQFYSCPLLSGDTVGICAQECTDDSSCSDSKKCCSNGCGMTCQTPVAIPYVALTESASCPPRSEVPCVKRIGGSCRDPAYPCGEGWMCCDNECASDACVRVGDLQPCLKARKIVKGNATTPLLGAYTPQCDADGRFQERQCHEHYCWCVDNATGKPLSDMVAYEDLGKLKCAGCDYNGKSYAYGESFPATDGCNQCTCDGGNQVACTEIGCTPVDDNWLIHNGDNDTDGLWEWWHTVLIVCASVVVLLGLIVAALFIGVLVLMKQNGQYRHQKLKEIRPEKVDMTGEDVPYQPHSPHEVQFKAGLDSIELKVPVEDTDEHQPAHA